MTRRGTKTNPFEVGEVVKTKDGGHRGRVRKVDSPIGGHDAGGQPANNPIRYLVEFGYNQEWLECRYLEACTELEAQVVAQGARGGQRWAFDCFACEHWQGSCVASEGAFMACSRLPDKP